MKNLGTHISSWFSIGFGLMGSILYPYFLSEGYLETWYLKITVFIASYGGLIASIIWYYKFLKDNK